MFCYSSIFNNKTIIMQVYKSLKHIIIICKKIQKLEIFN